MLNYESVMHQFPPGAITWATDPLPPRITVGSWYDDHGWYTQIGGYLEEEAWFHSINFTVSFSDTSNDSARRVVVSVYACPSDGMKQNEWLSNTWGRWRGNFVVNWGTTNYGQTSKGGINFAGAPFSYHRSARLREITDGVTYTLMMSECITVDDLGNQAGGNWGGPISDFTTSLGGGTFQAWLTPNSPVPDDVTRTCPPSSAYNGLPGCNLVGNDMTQQSLAARSHHPGGVNSSMCDGSVHFTSSEIDLNIWRSMSTSQGSDVYNTDW